MKNQAASGLNRASTSVRITPSTRTPPRRRIHRAFMQWRREMREQLTTPLRLERRTDRYIEMSFPEKTSALRVCLTTWEMIVAVEYEGHCWDLIACFEAIPKKAPRGYVCELCDITHRAVYESRDALWLSEIFVPFGRWIDDVLFPATAIALHGEAHRSTWAELISDAALQRHRDATHLIAMHR